MPLFRNKQELIDQGWQEQPDGRWKRVWGKGQNAMTSTMAKPEFKEPEKKRIRQSSKPLMNNLETEYYNLLRERFAAECPVLAQAIRFRLGNGIWYKPDFCILDSKLHCIEVKGPHAFRGGFENLKVAASLYPMIQWFLVWKDEQGRWQEQRMMP